MCEHKRNDNAHAFNDDHAYDNAHAYNDAHANANHNTYVYASYDAHASAIYAIDNYSFYVLDDFKNLNHNIPFF